MRSMVTVITVPELVSVHSGLRSRKALEKAKVKNCIAVGAGVRIQLFPPVRIQCHCEAATIFFV